MGRKKNRTVITITGDLWQHLPEPLQQQILKDYTDKQKQQRRQASEDWKRENQKGEADT